MTAPIVVGFKRYAERMVRTALTISDGDCLVRAAFPAARAARDTAGLVLTFRGAPISASYSASCGGRTRTLADAGLPAAGGYPYFSVECEYLARRHAAGERNGHGVGLCQEGATGMAAESGASFADILQHYYPATTLEMRSP